MALSSENRRIAARELARRMFEAKTANLNLDDIQAAVGAIDGAMDTVVGDLPAGASTLSIKQVLVASLPEPFAGNSSAQEKALALAVWAMKETGII